jgi:protein-tyrosine phosphatase
VTELLAVAFVCTGNRFRSPLAAHLLARETDEESVRIASLGTLDLGPLPALPEAVEMADELGVDLSDHRARSIDKADLGSADLVIGFERAHIAAAVVDGGADAARTFTLPQLVGLLGAIPSRPLGTEVAERARVRIRQANEARPPDWRTQPVAEIPDPLGAPRAVQRETAEELNALVRTLAQRLLG